MEANQSAPDPLRTQPLSQDLRAYVMRLLHKERSYPGGLARSPASDPGPHLERRREKFNPPPEAG